MSDYIVTKDRGLLHYGVKGMKWGVRKSRSNSSRKMAKLSKIRDRLAKDAKRNADENFEAARNVKSIYRDNFDKNDVDVVSNAFASAGKKYIETNKRLMSTDLNTVSKKQLKDVYWKGVREANKLNLGMDAFDMRDRRGDND